MFEKCLLATILTLTISVSSAKFIYNSPAQVNIAFIFGDCRDDGNPGNLSQVKNTLAHSAVWTIQRINNLRKTQSELGIIIQSVCSEEEYFKAVFTLYEDNAKNASHLTIVFNHMDEDSMPKKFGSFLDALDISLLYDDGKYYQREAIVAAVQILNRLGWQDAIEIVAQDQLVLKEFYRLARRDWLCVDRFHMLDSYVYDFDRNATHPVVFLGPSKDIALHWDRIQSCSDEAKIMIVPIDGEIVYFDDNTKENVLVLQATLTEEEEPWSPPKIVPSPLFLKAAAAIVKISQNFTHCKDNVTDDSCHKAEVDWSPKTVIEYLKIEALSSEFLFKLSNVNGTLLTYSMFDRNVTFDLRTDLETKRRPVNNSVCVQNFERCLLSCENFKSLDVPTIFPYASPPYAINLRPEPWVYAFLSLSLLGAIFALSILGFILSRLCRKQVLEGNPMLTILLLVDVIVIFASVVPFAVEGNKSSKYEVYLVRALCVTVPYTFAFALLLSRSILLATVSKEVGFMSHVAGSVQGFLTLFIFAVQCALSLQLTASCEDVFHAGHSLISLMSYNVVLLILLAFITPLVCRSKRNYREGKHFTLGIVLLAISWSCWLPAYAVLEDAWKDPLLCLGLVSTGSIFLGSIFIPRTYMMTVSAARERFTSTLPSLATATSAMDIYRASTQPVYDCINVAAIAAANLRAQHEQEQEHVRQRHDYYSAPQDNDADEEDDEDNFIVQPCDSPPIDKVTRF